MVKTEDLFKRYLRNLKRLGRKGDIATMVTSRDPTVSPVSCIGKRKEPQLSVVLAWERAGLLKVQDEVTAVEDAMEFMGKLCPRTHMVVLLHYALGLTLGEISRLLEMPRSSVYKRKRHGLAVAKKYMRGGYD